MLKAAPNAWFSMKNRCYFIWNFETIWTIKTEVYCKWAIPSICLQFTPMAQNPFQSAPQRSLKYCSQACNFTLPYVDARHCLSIAWRLQLKGPSTVKSSVLEAPPPCCVLRIWNLLVRESNVVIIIVKIDFVGQLLQIISSAWSGLDRGLGVGWEGVI